MECCLCEKMFENIIVVEIVREVGLVVGMVYCCFENKDVFILVLFEIYWLCLDELYGEVGGIEVDLINGLCDVLY